MSQTFANAVLRPPSASAADGLRDQNHALQAFSVRDGCAEEHLGFPSRCCMGARSCLEANVMLKAVQVKQARCAVQRWWQAVWMGRYGALMPELAACTRTMCTIRSRPWCCPMTTIASLLAAWMGPCACWTGFLASSWPNTQVAYI